MIIFLFSFFDVAHFETQSTLQYFEQGRMLSIVLIVSSKQILFGLEKVVFFV